MYSQFGEDGYLAFMINQIGVKKPGFVLDIGAGDPDGNSNVRYFIEKKEFNYLLIDGAVTHPMVANLFVTAENIVPFLKERAIPVAFDILSIDIDGNDYHVLQAVMQAGYRPRIVIAEINPIFDIKESFAMKYNPEHTWQNDDYYGMSLKAATLLMQQHGYMIVFVSDSLNAYYVRKELVNTNLKWEITYQKKNDHPHREGEWVTIK